MDPILWILCSSLGLHKVGEDSPQPPDHRLSWLAILLRSGLLGWVDMSSLWRRRLSIAVGGSSLCDWRLSVRVDGTYLWDRWLSVRVDGSSLWVDRLTVNWSFLLLNGLTVDRSSLWHRRLSV